MSTPMEYQPRSFPQPIEVYVFQTAKGETRIRAPWKWGTDSPRWQTVELIEPVASAVVYDDDLTEDSEAWQRYLANRGQQPMPVA